MTQTPLRWGLILAGGLALCCAAALAGCSLGKKDDASTRAAAAGGTGADGASAGAAAGGEGAAAPSGGKASTGGTDPGGAVAQVGGKAVSYKSFERYLNDNAGEDNDEGEQLDAIKSRLLDQFIEEQLLLKASEGLKIAVSEAEVDAYFKELGLTEGDVDSTMQDGKEAFRDRIRSSLIIEKVKEAAVLSKIHVTPGEVDDAVKKRPELTRSASLLVLRQILLDDKKSADEVAKKLQADPAQFEAVAKQKSVAPDKGQPRSYAEEDLPGDLRDAVTALQPGQVSPVLEHSQVFLIFQLVRRVEARTSDMAEVRSRIESELFRQKADQVMEQYLADLKGKTEIHVNRSILSFRYTGEYVN
jgi:parvulin-like peptidyl-prolyl isomerase